MAKYEGPDDIRSAIEREKRSRGLKPFTLAAAALGVLLCGIGAFFVIAQGFVSATDYKPEPARARIVKTEPPDVCIIHYDIDRDTEVLDKRLTTVSKAVFAKCKKYNGQHVTVYYDAKTWHLSDIKPIK